MTTIISWNVNGIRAIARKGFHEWFRKSDPDILCLQETKIQDAQIPLELRQIDGYVSHWSSARKPGYSGVATYVRKGFEPVSVGRLGIEEFDREGRVQCLEFPDFTLLNCYFPNSQEGGARLDYKIDFCRALHDHCETLKKSGRRVLISGDFNIAHKPIDLTNPQANEGNPGYLPEERAWLDEFVEAGYTDSFRKFDPSPGRYTWWSYRFDSRAKNIGWRLDYHFVDSELSRRLTGARILDSVVGSDHCPVLLDLS